MPLSITLNDLQGHLSYSHSKIRALLRSSCHITPNVVIFTFMLFIAPVVLSTECDRRQLLITLNVRLCLQRFTVTVADNFRLSLSTVVIQPSVIFILYTDCRVVSVAQLTALNLLLVLVTGPKFPVTKVVCPMSVFTDRGNSLAYPTGCVYVWPCVTPK